MTQKERDRLVALKKAKKGLITQKQAAAETGVSERQVRRLLRSLKQRGDRAVIHASRGRASNNKIANEQQEQAIAILSQEVYRGFGPTLAAEYLAKEHQLPVSHETVRKWMITAKLWRAKPKRIEKVHTWRARRSRFGELVQWDTSEHDWLEGRGPRLYLISMIDDATSRMAARFVEHDSTEENMRLLESYVRKHGRALGKEHNLAASLSHVESRQVASDYTIRFDNRLYQIARADICGGLRGGTVRVEQRIDGTLAVRFQNRYLAVSECAPQLPKAAPAKPSRLKRKPQRTLSEASRRSISGIAAKGGMPAWKAAQFH
jgi:transposase